MITIIKHIQQYFLFYDFKLIFLMVDSVKCWIQWNDFDLSSGFTGDIYTTVYISLLICSADKHRALSKISRSLEWDYIC